MTIDEFTLLHGPVVDPATLNVPKAREFAAAIGVRPELGVTLIEARQTNDVSTVVIEIAVSVGQKPIHDIRSREPLLISFGTGDSFWPNVYALRAGFPRAPAHLNVPKVGYPPSLCLSVQSYDEVQRDWTPGYYVRLLRRWLEDTARNRLHDPEQPVEPFLLEAAATLIVPHRLVNEPIVDDERWVALRIAPHIYRVVREEDVDGRPRAQLAFMSTFVPRRQHGAIAAFPADLAELCELVDRSDFALLEAIKTQISEWVYQRRRDDIPVLLLQIPITREPEGPVERYEVRAFALAATVEELGVVLGLLDPDNPSAALIGGLGGTDGAGVTIEVFNVHEMLSREIAAIFNGESTAELAYVAVGAGALGSLVLMNLTRSGAPPIAVIDKDRLLPHNLARHLLTAKSVGENKATQVAETLSCIIDGGAPISGVVGDILSVETDQMLAGARIVLDMSASVAVARHLALDVEAPGRRISLFLNPSGRDIVMLAEDEARKVRLDELEMQYYWQVATEGAFAGHFDAEKGVRYGGGCRDISSRIKQSSLAMQSGIGAAAFRRAASEASASAIGWRLDERASTVSTYRLDARPMRTIEVAGWTLLLSQGLVDEFARSRTDKLPNETGGILIGSLDMHRRRAYLVGSVPGPRDSVECPTGYIRGSYGLEREIKALCKRVADNLHYLGEWHSHPDCATTKPSSDDAKLYEWICDALADDGRPAIMLIVGRHDVRCIVGFTEAILDFAA